MVANFTDMSHVLKTEGDISKYNTVYKLESSGSVSGVTSCKNTANANAWKMWQAESLVTMPVLK